MDTFSTPTAILTHYNNVPNDVHWAWSSSFWRKRQSRWRPFLANSRKTGGTENRNIYNNRLKTFPSAKKRFKRKRVNLIEKTKRSFVSLPGNVTCIYSRSCRRRDTFPLSEPRKYNGQINGLLDDFVSHESDQYRYIISILFSKKPCVHKHYFYLIMQACYRHTFWFFQLINIIKLYVIKLISYLKPTLFYELHFFITKMYCLCT